MKRAAVATSAALLSGCFTWGAPAVSRRTVSTYGETTLRPDGLPGTARIQPDGSLHFQLDVARLCVRREILEDHTSATQTKEFATLGIVGLVAAGAFAGLGVYNAATADTDQGRDGGIFEIVVGGAAIGTLLFYRYIKDHERTLPAAAPVVRPGEIAEVACGTRAAPRIVGTMRLTTAWGEKVVAVAGSDGGVVFPVDWATSPTDPDAAGARAVLAAPWTINSEKTALAATWTPSTADLDAAEVALRAARDQRVITTEPPAVAVTGFEVDGGSLVAGRAAVLRVTVENRGGGTAVDLRATSRSSVPALHGLSLSFGNLQPKATKVRTVEVTLPEGNADTSITAVLSFAEGRGNPPADFTARFEVSTPLCPEGALPRAAFEAKMDKLRRAVDSGALTQADFDRYEAELVGCLQ